MYTVALRCAPSAHQTRVVDFEVVALADHVHLGALQRLVHAVDLVRARLILDHMVGQDALQLVRVRLELVELAAGSLSNAALVGANTVYWPLLSVSTRLTFGSTCPTAPPSRSTAAGCSTPPSRPGPVPFRPPTPDRSGAARRNPHTRTRSGRWPGQPRAPVIAGAAELLVGCALVACAESDLLLDTPKSPPLRLRPGLPQASCFERPSFRLGSFVKVVSDTGAAT